MWRYVLRRGLLMIPIFLVISVVIFSLIHIVPGNPIDNLMGPGMTLEHQRKLTEKYHLDKPIAIQYVIWFKNLLQGDLGSSIIEKRPVSELLMHHLPYSSVTQKIGGIESHGMIIAVEKGDEPGRWLPVKLDGVPPGSKAA